MNLTRYGECCGTCEHGEDYDWSGIRGIWYCHEKKERKQQSELCEKYAVAEYYKDKLLG